MTWTVTQMLQAIVDTIEAIEPYDKAHSRDTWSGRVDFPNPVAVDRVFGVVPSSAPIRRNVSGCKREYQCSVRIITLYSATDDAVVRIVEDGAQVTEALEDMRATYSDVIIDMVISEGDSIVAGEVEGTFEVSRQVVIYWERTE